MIFLNKNYLFSLMYVGIAGIIYIILRDVLHLTVSLMQFYFQTNLPAVHKNIKDTYFFDC